MTIEIPPKGTHGALFSGNPISRMVGSAYIPLYRALGGRVIGPNMLLLRTIGARTGRRRTTAVARFPDGEGRWIVVGSNGGSARHPAWFINLARNPDRVWVDVGSLRTRVAPELLRGAERAAAWGQITARSAGFAAYQRRTDRELPVIRLTRVVDGSAADGRDDVQSQ